MTRLAILAVAGVAIAAALVGCSNGNPNSTSRDASPTPLLPVAAASTSPTAPTGINAVDAAIDGELSDSVNRLERLIRYGTMPCVAPSDGMNASPLCRPGERDGKAVEVLPIGDCQGGDPTMKLRSFQRPDEFREDGITSIGMRLYAVYRASADSFPPGQYVVIFLRPPTVGGDVLSQTAMALTMTDDGITGINYGCDQTSQQLVASEHLTEAIIPPTGSDIINIR